MDRSAMEAKLIEARTAFGNLSPLVRHQAGHVLVPIMEVLVGVVQAIPEGDGLPSKWSRSCGEASCAPCAARRAASLDGRGDGNG